MAIFGTASSPFFSITFLVISALCLENFTDSTTAHPSLPHTTWNVGRRGSTDSWRVPNEFPQGPGSWVQGAGELGSIFHPNRSLFMIFRGDFWGCWGCFWDCYLGCLWEIWGGGWIWRVWFVGFWGCRFLLLGRLSRIPYESHVFDHLVRHDLCENKKITGWVDSWLPSLCSV